MRVQDGETDWGWGVVVNFNKRNAVPQGGALGAASVQPDAASAARSGGIYVVDVLLACGAPAVVTGATGASGAAAGGGGPPRPLPSALVEPSGVNYEMRVVPALLPTLAALSSVRVYLPKVRSRPVGQRAASCFPRLTPNVHDPTLLDVVTALFSVFAGPTPC